MACTYFRVLFPACDGRRRGDPNDTHVRVVDKVLTFDCYHPECSKTVFIFFLDFLNVLIPLPIPMHLSGWLLLFVKNFCVLIFDKSRSKCKHSDYNPTKSSV